MLSIKLTRFALLGLVACLGFMFFISLSSFAHHAFYTINLLNSYQTTCLFGLN